jgi:hypothetical protein
LRDEGIKVICDETELALLALPADVNCLQAEPVRSSVEAMAAIVLSKHRIIQFHGRAMIDLSLPYPHFEPLKKEPFREVAIPLLGWVKQQHLNHLYDYLVSTAPDFSWSDRFIAFGDLSGSNANVSVWDMKQLEFRNDISPSDCVWRSPYSVNRSEIAKKTSPIPFIMQVADGNEDIYDAIMQSLAPLVMTCKPEGIVWWVGGNTESKQQLIEAAHRLLPYQLSRLNFGRLDGGRQMPTLNGKLGNVVYDGTSAVEDVSLYRSLSKHQDFGVHRYRSQKGMNISGSAHHILSSSQAPTFSKKTWSTLNRTVIVPFSQPSRSNWSQELTADFYGQLIAEMCLYAVRIRGQGYRYSVSVAARPTQQNRPKTLPPLRLPKTDFIW